MACLIAIRGTPSPRKTRLIFPAVARHGFQWCRNYWFNEAMAIVERWADAGVPQFGVDDVRARLSRRTPRLRSAEDDWCQIGIAATSPKPHIDLVNLRSPTQAVFADAYRELFPNPFVTIDWQPDWRTTTVIDLASSIYERKAFDIMPILADALQDAGCEHQMILNHCRGTSPHARGCWVLDSLLGKE